MCQTIHRTKKMEINKGLQKLMSECDPFKRTIIATVLESCHYSLTPKEMIERVREFTKTADLNQIGIGSYYDLEHIFKDVGDDIDAILEKVVKDHKRS